MFKTTEANIAQIKATIEAYPQNGVWFHGCGNMYVDQAASDFRQKFTNPNSEESVYRTHFTSVSQVPATVEELNKKLMASRNQEMIQEKLPKVSQGIKTVTVKSENSAPALTEEEKEYQRLLAEENANKGK